MVKGVERENTTCFAVITEQKGPSWIYQYSSKAPKFLGQNVNFFLGMPVAGHGKVCPGFPFIVDEKRQIFDRQ